MKNVLLGAVWVIGLLTSSFQPDSWAVRLALLQGPRVLVRTLISVWSA
ncbi:hypothetical protein M2239_005622 [Bradyrhizobium elkanii]|jgi:hypothetical protein|nr:hypothetical protein [Bradyrhizobium elkanii]MCW2357448.1 hypothetical protein [Bradyrhizobium elkanii]